MYLAVAVQAIFTEQVLVRLIARKPLCAVGHAGVKRNRMALLALGRTTGDEQAFMNRAVGAMAQTAVLRRRGVFKEKGAALFLVAAEAGVVHRILHQKRIAQTAVSVVAIGAAGLAFQDGVV